MRHLAHLYSYNKFPLADRPEAAGVIELKKNPIKVYLKFLRKLDFSPKVFKVLVTFNVSQEKYKTINPNCNKNEL